MNEAHDGYVAEAAERTEQARRRAEEARARVEELKAIWERLEKDGSSLERASLAHERALEAHHAALEAHERAQEVHRAAAQLQEQHAREVGVTGSHEERAHRLADKERVKEDDSARGADEERQEIAELESRGSN